MIQQRGKKLKKSKNNASFKQLVVNPGWGKVRAQSATEFRRISYSITLTTNASNISVTRVGSSLMQTGVEWASYSARFTEYRILRTKIHVMDLMTGMVPANLGVCIIAQDQSGTLATPSTTTALWALASPAIYNLSDTLPSGIVYNAKAADLEDYNYSAVGLAQSTYAVFVAVTGIISTSVATLFVEWMVEFKSMQ
jgi:hypothetical protein